MKNAGRILLSTLILAGTIKYASPKIKNWAGESMKRLEKIEYNSLKKYMIGTAKIKVGMGEGFAKYISEDIKNNPKLNEMIQNRNIDFHSINALYKEINKGNPVGAGIYQRPIWNFNSITNSN